MLKSKIRRLARAGYEVKNSEVGWWVDGNCGYLVAGYFGCCEDAVNAALAKIKVAQANDSFSTGRSWGTYHKIRVFS